MGRQEAQLPEKKKNCCGKTAGGRGLARLMESDKNMTQVTATKYQWASNACGKGWCCFLGWQIAYFGLDLQKTLNNDDNKGWVTGLQAPWFGKCVLELQVPSQGTFPLHGGGGGALFILFLEQFCPTLRAKLREL